jgi:hypothetical protein
MVEQMEGNLTLSKSVYPGSAHSLKYYRLMNRGVQVSTSINIAQLAKGWGVATLGIGTLLDAKGVLNYYRKGSKDVDAVYPAKASSNLALGLYGLATGVPGAILGGSYYLIDTFYPGGFLGALENNARLQEQNRAVLGPRFNLYKD